MFLGMFWRFPTDKIDHLTRLAPLERKLLMSRVDSFKNRSREEEAGVAKIRLERRGTDEERLWHYGSETWLMPDHRPWLTLDSTADEETTRRSIVRIEQMFAAYSEILPPRTHPVRPLSIKLFGTVREYKTFLPTLGLPGDLQNPAVFVSGENLLAAGSELSAYARQLEEVRRRHAALRADYDRRTALMPVQLANLRTQLGAGGVSFGDQRTIVQLSASRWKEELEEINRQIKVAERRNLEQFDKLTAGMFARLFHEAFHAYLENYVFPQRDHDVPRWLNEGLAQIFETGQLEAGTLRLDAAKRLAIGVAGRRAVVGGRHSSGRREAISGFPSRRRKGFAALLSVFLGAGLLSDVSPAGAGNRGLGSLRRPLRRKRAADRPLREIGRHAARSIRNPLASRDAEVEKVNDSNGNATPASGSGLFKQTVGQADHAAHHDALHGIPRDYCHRHRAVGCLDREQPVTVVR
jgi:hypothetical protein